jgi:predicted amidohydrolase YtcJ
MPGTERDDQQITVFTAAKVITMDPLRPFARAIAVREGRILAAGEPAEMEQWLPAGGWRLDRTFEAKVVLPGFIDPHMHALMLGESWQRVYLGYYERVAPSGALEEASPTKQRALEKLGARIAAGTDGTVVTAWGYDPALLDGDTPVAREIDAVSGDVPVVIRNTSGHIMYVNTAAMRLSGIDRYTDVEGVVKDLAGEPTGELREMRAMQLVAQLTSEAEPGQLVDAVEAAARMAQRAGCTTMSDWAFGGRPGAFEAYREATVRAGFPVRVVLAPFYSYLLAKGGTMKNGLAFREGMVGEENEKLRVGPVKFMVDGSIQGFTADLCWPGYHNGAANGIRNMSQGELDELLLAVHRAGVQATIHTNGDGATECALRAIERALTIVPRPDHRHRLEHLQTPSTSQWERMAAMGVGGVIFPVHLYFWGDFHYSQTLGPDRARRMNGAASAKRAGVRVAFHSDAPVTPVGPLFSAWCAVNRVTATGLLLGEEERIPVADALRAITIDAAYQLHQDGETGSVEVGKRADFTVLENDPLEVAPERLKAVGVWGTVLGGVVQPVTERTPAGL